jgi:hypothetical protein
VIASPTAPRHPAIDQKMAEVRGWKSGRAERHILEIAAWQRRRSCPDQPETANRYRQRAGAQRSRTRGCVRARGERAIQSEALALARPEGSLPGRALFARTQKIPRTPSRTEPTGLASQQRRFFGTPASDPKSAARLFLFNNVFEDEAG